MPSRKAKGKAKGNFFSDKTTLPYAAKGIVRGQATNDACVAAVCRMLIFDRFPELEADIDFSESYLRHFLNTDEQGSVIADIPKVLRWAQINEYAYRADLTLDDLSEAVTRGFAVVSVYKAMNETGHVLIVEEVAADDLAVRDSLPANLGSSYRVRREDFESAWLNQKTGHGIGVIVVK